MQHGYQIWPAVCERYMELRLTGNHGNAIDIVGLLGNKILGGGGGRGLPSLKSVGQLSDDMYIYKTYLYYKRKSSSTLRM
jgi:hypothetical protein